MGGYAVDRPVDGRAAGKAPEPKPETEPAVVKLPECPSTVTIATMVVDCGIPTVHVLIPPGWISVIGPLLERDGTRTKGNVVYCSWPCVGQAALVQELRSTL